MIWPQGFPTPLYESAWKVTLSSLSLSLPLPLQVIHGCDPNAWHVNSNGITLNLLHEAILLKDTTSACFLVRNGADINSCTRPGSSGREEQVSSPGGKEFSPPLHMACERGLQEVVRCLIEHRVDINAKASPFYMHATCICHVIKTLCHVICM